MRNSIRSVRPQVWLLLGLVAAYVGLVAAVRVTRVIDTTFFLFVVQPCLALLLAGVAHRAIGGRHDRVRHKAEKSLIIASVIVVWFVVYFLSGLVLTFVHNAVAMSIKAVVINVLAFGIAAASIEYIRYSVMQSVNRRNVIWFGVLVSLVFACEQVSLSRLSSTASAVDAIQFIVADALPAIMASFLLTYLSTQAGFGPQLTYRLGVLATLLLPPIIPKYDWYLVGIASIVLTLAIYITIDRTRQDLPLQGRRYKHTQRAYDVVFLILLVVLTMFMLGVFTYKPLAIMSNSMHPVFSRGDLVVVQKAHAMDVHEGDIVQYEAPGRMVTHRVIKVDQNEDGSGERIYTTKGDNSPSQDPPVYPRQIVGIIRARIPYIGYPSVWLKELTDVKK